MGLKYICTLLTIIIAGLSCSTGQRTVMRDITVTVIDHKNGKPIDSAKVTLQILRSNNIDLSNETKYTTATGECRFSFEFDESARNKVSTRKEGYTIYINTDENDKRESTKKITNTTEDKIILQLTSDSLHLVAYYEKLTPHHHIDTLIELLSTDNYLPDISLFMPELNWEDIPKLLAIGNEQTKITNFPRTPYSSIQQESCYLGIISLWLIESIRITEENGIIHPVAKFPSQHAYLKEKDDQHFHTDPNNVETMEMAYGAYKDWWEEAKDLDKQAACEINPLEETNLRW